MGGKKEITCSEMAQETIILLEENRLLSNYGFYKSVRTKKQKCSTEF
jgi:hypothetical protein